MLVLIVAFQNTRFYYIIRIILCYYMKKYITISHKFMLLYFRKLNGNSLTTLKEGTFHGLKTLKQLLVKISIYIYYIHYNNLHQI